MQRTWVLAKLQRLDYLLRRDPVRVKTEIAKHRDGDLSLFRSAPQFIQGGACPIVIMPSRVFTRAERSMRAGPGQHHVSRILC